jgi:signal transduction histidine kinase/CheY-like chemotaxis protein
MMTGQRVLVVEDERIVAFNLQQRLSRLGYDVPVVAASGEEALRLARETQPDLVLMDIRIMGDIDGIETAARLNAERFLPVVYLTAHSDDATIDRARATRPYGYLLKPFSEREMHATIQMALERRTAELALAENEERLRLAFDVAGMGALDMSSGSGRIALSGRAGALLGFDGDVSTTLDGLLAGVSPVDREQLRDGLVASMSRLANYRAEFRTLIGEISRCVQLEARRLDGTRMIAVVHDISQRKQAEEALRDMNTQLERLVAERTAELRNSVAEIDAFSYSVAHDLRAPVRAIVAFSQILLEEHAQQLDADGRHFLDRIKNSGLRMAQLIDSLLALAHLSRVNLHIETVDLGALAYDVIEQLREADPGRRVEFIAAPALLAQADRGLMRIVLDNLLRNAWKFTSRHDSARIEFGAKQIDGETAYFVADDGAGFDMAFSDHLFGVFKRLHRDDEFSGTGIGLTTVQRVLSRHGGRIWADAGVEKGATFYFTLPAAKGSHRAAG